MKILVKEGDLRAAIVEKLQTQPFNSPIVHSALIKNILQGLPEPLILPGYKKIFQIITGEFIENISNST